MKHNFCLKLKVKELTVIIIILIVKKCIKLIKDQNMQKNPSGIGSRPVCAKYLLQLVKILTKPAWLNLRTAATNDKCYYKGNNFAKKYKVLSNCYRRELFHSTIN